jgi:hypothetical protein
MLKPEPHSPVVFEQGQRLSRPTLWELQREFFARQGVETWKQGTVPHYIMGGEKEGRLDLACATARPLSLTASPGGTRKGDHL